MPVNGPGPTTRSGVAGRAVDTGEAAPSKAKSKFKSESAKTQTSVVTPARMEEERLALVSEKQSRLAAVLGRHDDLVREKFHMETYTMMVNYDPQIAKKDESPVFQKYKSQYDLLDAATSLSPSPRKTRASHAGILKIAASGDAGPSHSVSAPFPHKKIIVVRKPVDLESSKSSHTKGKQKVLESQPTDDSTSISPARTRSAKQGPSTSAASKHLRKRPGVPEVSETVPPAKSENIREPPRKRRRINASASAVTVEGATKSSSPFTGSSVSAPVNGRVSNGKGRMEPPDPPLGEATASTGGRAIPHRAAAHRPKVPPPPLPHRHAVILSPSGIKRVKLLVRRPPLKFLSHPRQRPPPPQFNSSIRAYLGSWIEVAGRTFLVDRDKGSNEEVSRLAHSEAVLWEKVEAMKKAGRWFGSDLLDSFRAGGGEHVGGVGTPPAVSTGQDGEPEALLAGGLNSRPDDPWAAVVHSVISHRRKHFSGNAKARKSRGALIASQVAARIQGYWDGEATKLEKERVLEERRMKGVAKSVMKFVTAEWKKAVFQIREQERLKLVAEELRQGHEHLDAILDQSGHLLETQQGDLSRGVGDALRSRSRSGSVSVMGWGGDDEDDEDEDEQREEDEVEAEQDGDREGAVDSDNGDVDEVAEVDGAHGEDEHVHDDGRDANATEVEEEDREAEDLSSSALLLDEPIHSPGNAKSPSPSPLDLSADNRAHSLVPSTPGENIDREEDDEVQDLIDDSNEVDPNPSLPPFESNTDLAFHRSLTGIPVDTTVDPTSVSNPSVEHKAVTLSPTSPRLEVAKDDTLMAYDAGPTTLSSASLSEDGRLGVIELPGDSLVKDSEPGAVRSHDEEDSTEEEGSPELQIQSYLRPYAVAPVEWDPTKRVTPPLLLRGLLRPYQQSGLEWLASLHLNNLNGILADEMGLGKTIQTIALLAHLACDRGIWGPHLIIVPTSVLLNWEMEFKKFLPGFRTLSYHGSTKRRRELRQGWNEKHRFNVCITSYTLASRDAVIFKRKPWYYMILDEAHMIKNFKSQRWTTLLMFRSFRRLLLTGTPLQNNLTELWSLLQFLMSGSDFVNLKEFGDWFSNPLEKAIEAGNTQDEDTMQRVTKLHTVLRPYLLRRLKRDVEKELPSKFEHLVLCPLSKRQRFLYDEFMSRAHTRDALQSGIYQKIANILMQLRKVCNHPDLFEVRPIVTSFAMQRSAVADFEIKELLIRRRLFSDDAETVNLDLLGFRFIDRQGNSLIAAQETRRLDATTRLPFISEIPGVPPPKDTRTIAGFRAYSEYQRRAAVISRWAHVGYLNRLRCNCFPILSRETLQVANRFHDPLLPLSEIDTRTRYLDTVSHVNAAVKSHKMRADEMASLVDRFAFITPSAVALDLPRIALAGQALAVPPDFDEVLHRASVKLQIAFPDPSLIQYDCGKLQQLTRLLREKKAGGHRVLIFTQMTRILDILEIYLNFHGYLYLRLDGATKVEDRQYITERFNVDAKIFCFIASSRSGGVGINLTGADTVIFYDSDFNPQMDRQCEDRAHRIGQIRDVHIYRFVSQHTVEEAMLRKANQKRSLDELVIQKGEFDWRSLFADDGALTKALEEFDDTDDAYAAALAAREEVALEGQDKAEFLEDVEAESGVVGNLPAETVMPRNAPEELEPEEPEEEGGTIADYMIAFVERDADFFREWKL